MPRRRAGAARTRRQELASEMEVDYAVQSAGGGRNADGFQRKFCLCLRLRGWSTARAAGRRGADGVAGMWLRRHEAVGSEWLSIVRLSEHVPEPIYRARRFSRPQIS